MSRISMYCYGKCLGYSEFSQVGKFLTDGKEIHLYACTKCGHEVDLNKLEEELVDLEQTGGIGLPDDRD